MAKHHNPTLKCGAGMGPSQAGSLNLDQDAFSCSVETHFTDPRQIIPPDVENGSAGEQCLSVPLCLFKVCICVDLVHGGDGRHTCAWPTRLNTERTNVKTPACTHTRPNFRQTAVH